MTTRFEEVVQYLEDDIEPEMAAYLRDLHASHEALLKALRKIDHDWDGEPVDMQEAREAIRAAEDLRR